MSTKKNPTKSRKKNRKSRIITGILGTIIILGLCSIAYPTVSNWWNQRHATQAIASYVEQVKKIEDSSIDEMLSEARTYNEALPLGVDFTLTEEEYETYESVLDVSGTGIMGYVEIPSINVLLPIYHGTSEEVLETATGHVAGSSLPIGGEGTHAVISGHRGLPTANLFTHLDQVAEGDIFTITVLNQVLTYQIDQIRIVLPEDTSDLAIESGKDYVTLVTCTPYGVNTHRMLVRGHRIENLEEEGTVIVVADATRISTNVVICGIGIPLIIIAMIGSFVISGIKGKRKSDKKILEEMEKSVDAGGKEDEK